MCVVCRVRAFKSELIKFKANFAKTEVGRSFYICKNCVKKDESVLQKSLKNVIKTETSVKEKLLNEKSEN